MQSGEMAAAAFGRRPAEWPVTGRPSVNNLREARATLGFAQSCQWRLRGRATRMSAEDWPTVQAPSHRAPRQARLRFGHRRATTSASPCRRCCCSRARSRTRRRASSGRWPGISSRLCRDCRGCSRRSADLARLEAGLVDAGLAPCPLLEATARALEETRWAYEEQASQYAARSGLGSCEAAPSGCRS